VDEVMSACSGRKTAWPDLAGSVDRATVSGDRVACEMVWRGTHSGPFTMPDGSVVPPSGKTTAVPGCMVLTFENGKCVEMNHYFDALWIMIEIGAIPIG
jgi:predicted ester cyclase